MDKPAVITSSDEVDTYPLTPVRCQRLKSVELFGKAREVVIEHGGDEYRLRLTSQGKLILTK